MNRTSDHDVMDQARGWAARGEGVAVATVVRTQRSAPRPIGTRMVIGAGGGIDGSVSGGCVEGAVVEAAEMLLAGGAPQLLEYGISDEQAWDVGLQCGGAISVWLERWQPSEGTADDRLLAAARDGRRAAVVTLLGGERAGAKLFVGADGERQGTLGAADLDADAAAVADTLLWEERSALREVLGQPVFVDVVAPPPRLFVFGAVDYATALCALAAQLGWRPFVIDPRARFAQPERFPAAEEVVAKWPQEAFAQLGGIDAATAIVVLTHDPKLDDAALEIALRSPAVYVGAMGSRRAQESRRERLLALGLGEDELARIAAPVGLDLGAQSAEETALSIMAEIVALRRGRSGGRLRDASGRIHATAP
jgi:xanthine dehydrogenase accessory factor